MNILHKAIAIWEKLVDKVLYPQEEQIKALHKEIASCHKKIESLEQQLRHANQIAAIESNYKSAYAQSLDKLVVGMEVLLSECDMCDHSKDIEQQKSDYL